MVLVSIAVFRDEFVNAQKAELIEQVTDGVARALREEGRPQTWVVLEEIENAAELRDHVARLAAGGDR